MKTKRIEMYYEGGLDTILYSVKKDCFWSYERQKEDLHKIYGGRHYYKSLTGLSGAGFLEVEWTKNDIIIFGCYRTDAKTGQKIVIVHVSDMGNGKKIFGYAPITSHNGINYNAPFVLTDGSKVAFVRSCDVKESLLKWEEIKGKDIEITWFDTCGKEHKLIFELYNPDHFRGVRATRFVDLRGAREAISDFRPNEVRYNEPRTLFLEKLQIFVSKGKWFHLNTDGIFDIKWTEDPASIKGEIVSGWNGAGDGLYWRRRRNDVETFVEAKRKTKYMVKELQILINYEQNFSILEWFSKSIREWKTFFRAKITKKARQDYVYARASAGVDTRSLMAKCPEVEISIQDSLNAGNCEIGTREFCSRYNITDENLLIKDLLENPKINEMLKVFEFQKVVYNKLVS